MKQIHRFCENLQSEFCISFVERTDPKIHQLVESHLLASFDLEQPREGKRYKLRGKYQATNCLASKETKRTSQIVTILLYIMMTLLEFK